MFDTKFCSGSREKEEGRVEKWERWEVKLPLIFFSPVKLLLFHELLGAEKKGDKKSQIMT